MINQYLYFDSQCKMQCFIDALDNSSPEASFFERKTRKANKTHICGECGDKISSGQKYEHVKGNWDGCFETYKTCLTCLEIRSRLFCSFHYESIWEDLSDYDFIPNMANLLEFSPQAQQKLIEHCVLNLCDFDEDDD